MEMVTKDLYEAMRRLSALLAGFSWIRLGFATAFIICAGFLAAVPAALMGRAVDRVLEGQPLTSRPVVWILVLLCAALVVFELMHVCRKWLVESVAVRLQADAQLRFADILLSAPVDVVQRRQVGEIITLIDKGVTGLVRLMKLVMLEFGPAAATAVIAVAFVVSVHWKIAAVMIAVLVVNGVVTAWQIASQRGIRIDLLRRRIAFNSQVGELVMNLDSVRASGVGSVEQAEFKNVAEAVRVTELRHHQAMMTFDALKGLSDGGGLVLILIVALVFFAAGQITGGDIVKITLLYQNAIVPLRMLHRVFDESHEAAIHIVRADEVVGIGRDLGLDGRDRFDGANVHPIAFTAVGLSFGFGADGGRLLDNAEYVVPRGTFDVILGETGSGKSTMLRIMLGLVAGYEGQAKVFGTEVKTADKVLLSRRICYVAQEPFIRSGDLRSNLLLGVHGPVADEELLRAAALAGLNLGNGAWREGLDRQIAERGKGLSGGERQRIALARLFLSQADLYILDEATSQLDEAMENLVLGNLTQVFPAKSIVMVAHRSTARKWAKRSYKLEGGRLVELPPYFNVSEPIKAA